MYYNKDIQFELTEEELARAFLEWDKGKRVFIRRLKVSLSPNYLWAGDKPDDPNIGYTKEDNRKVIKQFGTWVFPDDTKLKPNLDYYKSLAKDNPYTESEYQKIKEEKLTQSKKFLLKGETK